MEISGRTSAACLIEYIQRVDYIEEFDRTLEKNLCEKFKKKKKGMSCIFRELDRLQHCNISE